jgi:hypothetical protein
VKRGESEWFRSLQCGAHLSVSYMARADAPNGSGPTREWRTKFWAAPSASKDWGRLVSAHFLQGLVTLCGAFGGGGFEML